MRIYTVSNISKKVVELGEGMKGNVIFNTYVTCDKALSLRSEGEKEHLIIFFSQALHLKKLTCG